MTLVNCWVRYVIYFPTVDQPWNDGERKAQCQRVWLVWLCPKGNRWFLELPYEALAGAW